MAQLPFIIASGLTIGSDATTGNINFNATTGNLTIGNLTTGVGNLIVNSNANVANTSFAMSVTNGGMSIQGNLYVNGQFGLHASMSNAATISPGDIFFTVISGTGAWVPVGTVITQSSGVPGGAPISVSTGSGTIEAAPNGTYRCLGLFQTGQFRGMFTRLT